MNDDVIIAVQQMEMIKSIFHGDDVEKLLHLARSRPSWTERVKMNNELGNVHWISIPVHIGDQIP